LKPVFFDIANISLAAMNERCKNTLNTALGIEFSAFGPDYLEATMPVNVATVQPLRMLNGGASLALIETVGSMAANLALDRNVFVAVGQSVTGFHMRPVFEGDFVTARAEALHIGSRSHIWEVILRDSKGNMAAKGSITMAVINNPAARV
jgi:1,4-dihydroxy-2-naphthoyl-CoA hydrolase